MLKQKKKKKKKKKKKYDKKKQMKLSCWFLENKKIFAWQSSLRRAHADNIRPPSPPW